MSFYLRMLLLSLATATWTGCKYGKHQSNVKIVGGEKVENASDRRVANSTVFLHLESKDKATSCTGTLIGPRHVVTAAHCLDGVKFIAVGYGPKLERSAPHVKASAFLIHPKFRKLGRGAYDIGVVSLPSPFPAPMKPVVLAKPDEVKTGTELLLAGYGLTAQEYKGESELHQVRVKVASTDATKHLLSIEANTKRGGCNGDSGGPAYIDRGDHLILVGATSGPSFGMEKTPCDEGHGIWSIVPQFQGWMACAFASHDNPLDGLKDDESKVDCPAKKGASSDSNCNYDHAAEHGGWGFNPATGNGDNCPPR